MSIGDATDISIGDLLGVAARAAWKAEVQRAARAMALPSKSLNALFARSTKPSSLSPSLGSPIRSLGLSKKASL